MDTTKREMMKERDILSSLPDDVLSSIISHLPPKEAVRTSILSRRWSRTWWGSITSLSIDVHAMNRRPTFSGSISAYDSDWIENINKWIDIIDKILRSCQGSIRDCQINCYPPRYVTPNYERLARDVMERLVFSYERWAEILTRGGIERFVFFSNDGRDKVPSVILNCDSMRFLVLSNCLLEPKFSFDGCRYLKVLTLVQINFLGHPIHHAISRCVHLEKLYLFNCYGTEDLIIHVQNLKYLFTWLDTKMTIDINGPNLTAMVLVLEAEVGVKRFCVRAPNLQSFYVNTSRTWTEEMLEISNRIRSYSFQEVMNIFELCIPSNVNILALLPGSMEVHIID
ncbi:F-box/FBD/LRR-repeat protein At1g13570-like [Magnolia sinica]|uniref:F-box/FBD/LRR-repeat protein At1g13570-like n=1 Tax=Magnolia sinica TaxID=86752 RepID=UPI00265A46AC|nr:F-box/FBD/LRR-repeat protein At1g13570-like [Magnolia sinica]